MNTIVDVVRRRDSRPSQDAAPHTSTALVPPNANALLMAVCTLSTARAIFQREDQFDHRSESIDRSASGVSGLSVAGSIA